VKKHPSICLLLLLYLFTTIISCKQNKEDVKIPTKASPSAAVDVFVLSPTSISQQIEVPGSITPFEATELHAETAGRVTAITFTEGTTVTKGSILIKLYDADLQAQLKKIQVQLAIAQKTEQRQHALLKISGISQQDYDNSNLAVNNLLADIEILKTSIAKTEIRAPYTGKIGFRNISLGAYVTPATIISTIRAVQQLKLTFALQERYGAKIKNGALVHFSIDGNKKVFAAIVMATENNITTDTRSLLVKAIVQNSDVDLISGAFAKVQIDMGKNETALMIPTQAIIPQAKNKKVMLVQNGMATMQIVSTGIRDTTKVEITSGLKNGDTILISGLLNTKPGSAVKIKTITQ
jgi:membrane fusion protein, multidrug efflux system